MNSPFTLLLKNFKIVKILLLWISVITQWYKFERWTTVFLRHFFFKQILPLELCNTWETKLQVFVGKQQFSLDSGSKCSKVNNNISSYSLYRIEIEDRTAPLLLASVSKMNVSKTARIC